MQNAEGGMYSHHFALEQCWARLCIQGQIKDIKISAGNIINKTSIFFNLQITNWQHPVVSITNIGVSERYFEINIYLLHGARVLLEKLTGSQLVKKFPAFYGTRRFITAFTTVRHLRLPWERSIRSMPPPTSRLPKIHLNIILSSTPGSSKLSLSLRHFEINLNLQNLNIRKLIIPNSS